MKQNIKIGPMVIVGRGNGVGRCLLDVPVLYEGCDDGHVEELYEKLDTEEFQTAWHKVMEAYRLHLVPVLRDWGKERARKRNVDD